MKRKATLLVVWASTLFALNPALAQEHVSAPRRISLEEAVQLALKQNHMVRIADLTIAENKGAKAIARSAYLPSVRNQTQVLRVTDTQFIELAQGSLGTIDGTPIPETSSVINQGGRTFATSGTTLVQPLTQLFTKIKPANQAAQADVDASRADAQETRNQVALKVHQIYYQLMIAQLRRGAIAAKIKAVQDLTDERVQQVKYGSALDQQLIESRAQLLQAKHDLLTTELQISDQTMALNDVMGLPLRTQLTVDTALPASGETCDRKNCLQIAQTSHPEILAARAQVEKASAGVRSSKGDYVPEISAFAQYDYQKNVPFLASNFGTFGAKLTYDLFDGGKRNAGVKESEAKLAQAKENLARVIDDVELRVETALDRVDQTKEMVDVSEQVLALRTESSRMTAQQLSQGEALQSQAAASVAEELDAKVLLLAAQLDYAQANDELVLALGLSPQ